MSTVLSQPLPAWARDATLGVFVHWGAYSVPAWAEPIGALGAVPDEEWFAHNAYAEWYANTIRIAGSPAAERHAELHGDAPYTAFLEDWTADRYDPADWARLFAAIGADYVVPTTKHHDGIALWDAPGAGELSTVARGPRRDLIGPLATAVREAGMRFGVYYSGGLDWAFAEHPPLTSSDDVSRLRPVGDDYNDYAFAQVADLIDRYAPEVLWNDIDWPDTGKQPGPTSIEALLTRFRAAAPEGIVNDRWGAPVGDYRTSEYDHDTGNETDIGWEHCRGLGFSFGHNAVEDEALTLSPRELARLYADVVSRGGRLLLNVGPTAAGEIPEVQRRTLEGVAPWLAEVKPATVGRSTVERAGIRVTVPGSDPTASTDEPWWRAWRNADGLVVVVDDPRAIVQAQGPVTVVALPGDTDEETA